MVSKYLKNVLHQKAMTETNNGLMFIKKNMKRDNSCNIQKGEDRGKIGTVIRRVPP